MVDQVLRVHGFPSEWIYFTKRTLFIVIILTYFIIFRKDF